MFGTMTTLWKNICYPALETLSCNLGRPISLLEIQEAIKVMQNGKSPGPDGYTVQFYKTTHNSCTKLWHTFFLSWERWGLVKILFQLLYSAPVASVITYDLHSPFFPHKRGTKQGCPSSPLLFAIAIEPLAIWLRSEAGFEGIVRGGVTHKVSLYADDLLLYISHLPFLLLCLYWSSLVNFQGTSWTFRKVNFSL